MSELSDESNDIFPRTSWSILRAAAGTVSHSRAALNELCVLYRNPVLLVIRRHGFDTSDAEDLAQDYFVGLLTRNFLGEARPEDGRFRAFLRTDLKWFLQNARRKRTALRRGGAKAPVSLERLREEGGFDPPDPEPSSIDDYFDRQCALAIVKRARDSLAKDYDRRGKGALFQRLQVGLTIPTGDSDYDEWANELGLSPGSVKVAMHRLRGRFRKTIENLVRDSVATEEDFQQEMTHLRRSLSHGTP